MDGKEFIKPDVAAPGKDVLSSWPGGGYRHLSGTSMAAPHVGGLAALILEKHPTLLATRLRKVIERGAIHPEGEGQRDNDWGRGLIDCPTSLAMKPP